MKAVLFTLLVLVLVPILPADFIPLEDPGFEAVPISEPEFVNSYPNPDSTPWFVQGESTNSLWNVVTWSESKTGFAAYEGTNVVKLGFPLAGGADVRLLQDVPIKIQPYKSYAITVAARDEDGVGSANETIRPGLSARTESNTVRRTSTEDFTQISSNWVTYTHLAHFGLEATNDTLRIRISRAGNLTANNQLFVDGVRLEEVDSLDRLDVPPADVGGDALESSGLIRMFKERSLFLVDDLAVNILPIPGETYGPSIPVATDILAAGQTVTCFLMHMDPVGAANVTVSARLTFDRPILGLIHATDLLNNSDAQLGLPGVIYTNAATLYRGCINEDTDHVRIGVDGRTLELTMRASATGGMDQLRVLTEPGAIPLSVVRFEPAPEGLVLSFTTETDQFYSLETSSNLMMEAWNPVPEWNYVFGTGLPITLTNTPSGSPEYYRVIQEP